MGGNTVPTGVGWEAGISSDSASLAPGKWRQRAPRQGQMPPWGDERRAASGGTALWEEETPGLACGRYEPP
jgi:hypothetical protein